MVLKVFFTDEGISLVEQAAWRTGRWANGGGVTHTIAAWPDATDPPAVRLSVADIARPGPFSRFAGHDRWLAVIDDGGGPLHLAGPARARPAALATGAFLAFSGDEPITATPAGPAPARVFNLILRAGISWQARVTAAGETLEHPPGLTVLFSPDVPITADLDTRAPLAIPRHATALVTSPAPVRVRLRTGPAFALWIAAFTLLTACATRPVRSFPSELRAQSAALQTTGTAEIQSIDDGRFTVRATTEVEVAEPSDDGARLVRNVTIAELVAGCPAPGTPAPACLADRVVEREMVVGEKRHGQVGPAITSGLAAFAGLALVGTCLAECENKDIAIGAGLTVAGAGLFLLMLATMK